MKARSIVTLLMLSLSCFGASAQRNDTVLIQPKDVNSKVLKEGVHRYLVYFRMQPGATRGNSNFWTRTIRRTNTGGKATISITQQWEDKDTIIHTTSSVSDAETMRPISHESWWKGRGTTSVNFEPRSLTVNGREILLADTAKRNIAILTGFKSTDSRFFLNWHLDLEIFPTLPFKKGRTFMIPFYDPGTASVLDTVAYTVTGTEILDGYNNQKIDCWIMMHESKGNREKFFISKKNKEVLKLEQEINGKMWRYKVKLPILDN